MDFVMHVSVGRGVGGCAGLSLSAVGLLDWARAVGEIESPEYETGETFFV